MRKKLGFSERLLTKYRQTGGVWRNGIPVRLIAHLHRGDLLDIYLLAAEKPTGIRPESIPIDVVFADRDYLVVNKPPTLVVHPTGRYQSGTLANAVAGWWAQQGLVRAVHPMHRIDRQTSGLILFANSRYAHERLAPQVDRHEMERRYLAIVSGLLEEEEGEIDLPIGRQEALPTRRRVSMQEGVTAMTRWKVRERLEGATVVEVQPLTGRTHQIRVHFAAIGHPLVGDRVYGQPSPLIDRQALHSAVLGFVHPQTQERLRFEAPLPEDMQRLVEALRPLPEALQ